LVVRNYHGEMDQARLKYCYVRECPWRKFIVEELLRQRLETRDMVGEESEGNGAAARYVKFLPR
jgi:hypothetical protein